MGGMVDVLGQKITHSVTFPHYYDSLGFVKPIEVPYTALQKLLMPFLHAVWFWLLAAFVAVSIVHYLVFGQSLFDQIIIVMGGSLTRIPRAITPRSLISMWMLATLILRNAYQGALFDILQAQIQYQPVENNKDLIRFNYVIYCEENACGYLKIILPHLMPQLSLTIKLTFIYLSHIK